jgi:hypothetical protein
MFLFDEVVSLIILGVFKGSNLSWVLQLLIKRQIIDGVLNIQIAQTLSKGKGRIHGVDASEAMIASARKAAAAGPAAERVCTFEGS